MIWGLFSRVNGVKKHSNQLYKSFIVNYTKSWTNFYRDFFKWWLLIFLQAFSAYTNDARSYGRIFRKSRTRKICPNFPRGIWHTRSHMESWNAYFYDSKNRLPFSRFHAQIEIQRQSFVPVLSNTHGFLSSIGVRIILRYLLLAKFVQRQQIPRLADIKSTQAFERR